MSILDAVDQRVRDAGFNFVPFNRFLASPFQLPTDSPASSDAAAAGIPAIYQPRPQGNQGGGDYAASLGLGPNTRGFIGNFRDIDPSEMYNENTPSGLVPGMDKPAIDFIDAPVDFRLRENNPAVFDPLVNAKNLALRGVDKTKDLGAKVFGGILSAATGIPFLGAAFQGLSNRFVDRPLGAAVVDEFGNVYDEEELNKQNALGGFYSEAARSARRRTKRIENMLRRRELGKTISEKNLRELQEQERIQEAIRQEAFREAVRQGPDFYDSLRGGRGSSVSRASREQAGPGFGDVSESASFADGGIVDLVDIYD